MEYFRYASAEKDCKTTTLLTPAALPETTERVSYDVSVLSPSGIKINLESSVGNELFCLLAGNEIHAGDVPAEFIFVPSN